MAEPLAQGVNRARTHGGGVALEIKVNQLGEGQLGKLDGLAPELRLDYVAIVQSSRRGTGRATVGRALAQQCDSARPLPGLGSAADGLARKKGLDHARQAPLAGECGEAARGV
jgi:hypothetical protein